MPESPPPRPRILSAEDEPAVGKLVKAILERDGYNVEVASTGAAFLKSLAENPPDLCLLDVHLPDANGLDLLKQAFDAGIPAVMATGEGDLETVISAMRLGAVDYVRKPLDSHRLSVSVRNALHRSRQDREIARLRSDIQEAYAPEHLVGSSPAIAGVRDLIRKAAPSDATVLVTGESGVGKELIAKALHFAGRRRDGPFVDVNSAALSDTLLESEIFGHEKGAFTGATGARRGRFEQADGGTIFLDEIGDMPPPTQAKILRVLQERAFQRVGGEEKITVDVRVVCATNRNLEEAVEKGAFRKDLFYRINTFVIGVPPLRERSGDIPEFARHFLALYANLEKRPVPAISKSAVEILAGHPWPGNVRELQHAIHRAVLLCEGGEIRPEHLPPALTGGAPQEGESGRLMQAVEALERRMILAALQKTGWVKARAARELGVTERIITYKMQNLGLTPP